MDAERKRFVAEPFELKGDKTHTDYIIRLADALDKLSDQQGRLDIILKKSRRGQPITYTVRTTFSNGAVGKGFVDSALLSVKTSHEIRQYDATYSHPKSIILHFPCDQTPHLQDIASLMKRPDNEILKLSELQKDKGIIAFAFTINIGSEEITMWGSLSSSKVLDPAHFFLFSSKEGRFEAISEQYIVAIPKRVDAISNPSSVYIFNQIKFETIFDFKDGFIANIESNKNKLNLVLKEPDKLIEWCSKHLDSTRKLFSAIANFDQRKLTPDIAKKIAKLYKLNIRFDSDGLIDITTSSLNDIVKLLDDDLVKSAQNPRLKYITHGKTPA